MANTIPLRPEESVLFEGTVDYLKSKLSVMQTEAVITAERLILAGGKHAFDKAQIAAAAEEKHGLAKKVVFRLHNGASIALAAPNHARLKAAALVLTGQGTADALPKEPERAHVKSGTAWLAAFGPLIAGFIMLMVGAVFWGPVEDWGGRQELQAFLGRVVLTYMFLAIDHRMLQRQGYSVHQLGLSNPTTFPMYLFSRAKVFGHTKAPAVIWCLLAAGDLLVTVL